MTKTLLLHYPNFKPFHLVKDRGQLLQFFSEKFGYETAVLCEDPSIQESRKYIKDYYKSTTLLSYIQHIWRLKPDVLLLFYVRLANIPLILLYKLLKPQGKIYIRGDIYYALTKKESQKRYVQLRFRIAFLFYRKFVTLFSVETTFIKEYISEKHPFMKGFVQYIPNGVNLINQTPPKPVKKENLIITIARHGTYQKNSQLTLQAAINFLKAHPDWRMVYIGPTDDETNYGAFKEKMLKDNPHEASKMEFLGPIYERDKVERYLALSKIFLFTSRWESFGLVLAEAAYFKMGIASTDVGAMGDITQQGTLCPVAKEETLAAMSNLLETLVNADLEKIGESLHNNIHTIFSRARIMEEIDSYLDL